MTKTGGVQVKGRRESRRHGGESGGSARTSNRMMKPQSAKSAARISTQELLVVVIVFSHQFPCDIHGNRMCRTPSMSVSLVERSTRGCGAAPCTISQQMIPLPFLDSWTSLRTEDFSMGSSEMIGGNAGKTMCSVEKQVSSLSRKKSTWVDPSLQNEWCRSHDVCALTDSLVVTSSHLVRECTIILVGR